MSIYQTPRVYSNTVEMVEEVDICHRLKKTWPTLYVFIMFVIILLLVIGIVTLSISNTDEMDDSDSVSMTTSQPLLLHNSTMSLASSITPDFSESSDIDFDIKFAFTPLTRSCSERFVVPLGQQIYASVCSPKGDIIVDIRRFIVSEKGIYPTIRGISLNVEQWQNMIAYINTISNFVKHLQTTISEQYNTDVVHNVTEA